MRKKLLEWGRRRSVIYTTLAVTLMRCAASSRAAATCSRYGGEEFAVLLPQTNAAAAVNFAERIREILNQLQVEYGGNQISFTASFGVFTWSAGYLGLGAYTAIG